MEERRQNRTELFGIVFGHVVARMDDSPRRLPPPRRERGHHVSSHQGLQIPVREHEHRILVAVRHAQTDSFLHLHELPGEAGDGHGVMMNIWAIRREYRRANSKADTLRPVRQYSSHFPRFVYGEIRRWGWAGVVTIEKISIPVMNTLTEYPA